MVFIGDIKHMAILFVEQYQKGDPQAKDTLKLLIHDAVKIQHLKTIKNATKH